MARALELASQADGCLLPNPKVGAVIVYKEKIVGEGFHRGPGLPHAEVEAIRDAERKKFKNFSEAEIFINLEPCCAFEKKRTPGCAPLLVQKKFARVIAAHLDPNPKVSGDGVKELKKGKIKVDVGCLANQAAELNQAFIKNQQLGLPYVTIKMATTFDGRMADDFGSSQWITGTESRASVHLLRHQVDAVGVGKNTVTADQPFLNARLTMAPAKKGSAPSPKKEAKMVVVFGEPHSKSLSNIVKANGPKNLIILKERAPLRDLLRPLYEEHGICHLLVEGGPKLIASFLEEGAVDEIIHFFGTGYLLGFGQNTLQSPPNLALKIPRLKRLEASIKFQPKEVSLLGSDICARGFLHVYRPYSKSRKS
ncbi:MAG: bifunctional diaminohydroxyphosphoribosylaminopyrimidine deaminase/5-amino-6-(5-phosphoribosylamino)uracil reductase RibD [Deltaproteobacteria bacterium]|nr:bifunctional diaminohydroxyphosphoribosylaminopyrimidine deaminase/5-amino-6-(5-phosphoribosylamino)uracil reductase RibD [Deltaproteobacteria bacterium]